MARTPAGEALTEAHKAAQGTISGAVIQQVLNLWRLLDPADIKGSFPAFLKAVLPILELAHGQSASLAGVYLAAFREAEGAPAGDVVLPTTSLNAAQATTSLLVTGPVAFLTGIRAGQDEATAMQNALTQALGASSRLALGGGRDTILGVGDRHLVGYARTTSGKPCHFCALLASRGAVYSRNTAGFDAHDGCHCQPEPVYSDGNGEYQNPGRADEFRKLYDESTAGLGSADSLTAFRRAYNQAG